MSLPHQVRFASARAFGRGLPRDLAAPAAAAPALADDLKLFAATFAGGFLFMAVYLA